jgi:hypothetical protein
MSYLNPGADPHLVASTVVLTTVPVSPGMDQHPVMLTGTRQDQPRVTQQGTVLQPPPQPQVSPGVDPHLVTLTGAGQTQPRDHPSVTELRENLPQPQVSPGIDQHQVMLTGTPQEQHRNLQSAPLAAGEQKVTEAFPSFRRLKLDSQAAAHPEYVKFLNSLAASADFQHLLPRSTSSLWRNCGRDGITDRHLSRQHPARNGRIFKRSLFSC